MERGKGSQNIEYYYKKNRFLHLLIETKKYKDLYNSKEAAIALILSIALLIVILNIYSVQIEKFEDFSKALLLSVGAGLTGLLGFLITGVSVFSSGLSYNVLKKINNDNKFRHLISIVFSFYFAGSIILATIILFIISYALLYTSWAYNWHALVLGVFSCSYFMFFSLIYTTMLLGSSLRVIILNYIYNKED